MRPNGSLCQRDNSLNFYYDNEGFFKEKHAKKFGVIQLILSLTVTVIIFFVGFISLIESTFNCYVLLMPFALAIIVFILPVLLYLWPEKKDVTPRNILLTVCGCIALFSFGHDQAWLATFYGSTFRVNLENDKPICGRIVFRGERGILIENGKSGHQVFLPRGRIKSTESAATIVCKDLNGHKAA
jgi:heme/copper-type cytochrome/quinol oxidase subunit 4